MATLVGPRGAEVLPCRCLIGRSAVADLRLESRGASSEHATIRWQGGKWSVRDLASRNGTSVNDVPLAPRVNQVLSVGQTLIFGAPEERWLVTDTTAPEPCAIALDGSQRRWGVSSLLLLPTDEEPDASILLETAGWRLEQAGASRLLQSGEVINVGRSWRLLLPDNDDAVSTATIGGPMPLEMTELSFKVSPDEEHVELTLRHGKVTRTLPPRACLYTLLTLARVRLSGQEGENERGWLAPHALADLLKVSPERVHVDFHRIRRLFQDAGLRDGVHIIQRDEGSRRVRIGVGRLSIEKLER